MNPHNTKNTVKNTATTKSTMETSMPTSTAAATEAAAPATSKTGLALALLVWAGLSVGAWCSVQRVQQSAPVPLHHLHLEAERAQPQDMPAQAVADALASPMSSEVEGLSSAPAAPAVPVPVLALPQDPAVPAAICAPWLQRWPALSRPLCEQALLAPSGAQSVRGQPIAWRDVAPSGEQAADVRVLVVGAIHGDELTAAALALHWVPMAQAAEALDGRTVHWRFIPVLNPDGLLARPATRTNASGVDLNRNFPTLDWEQAAPLYWEQRTRRDPRRWPGPAPLSEPESQFLHAQMQQFAPDLVVSIHAPYGLLDFDGPQTPPQKLGQLHLDRLGVFPGSLGNYGGLSLGVPVVTIELHHALRMPVRAEINAMWRDLLGWMQQHL